ncbi:hypothetical protein BBK36DRAFT_1200107 [Trichoderma citrinoviride]|uniref:Transcription factor domain-containing protein n=1 Tax=Trichoderma citrinoviride TaxID=58853 RepID=A0A2T4B9W6_9HYPO|nr:hypothetical protein BBK36DRAFT_1200107 [Trichoderma citrinoviride]PTB66125.1 hypothetical protein BBK36DRAFT_1200107 [Trichoderma citrinoviride]
MTDSLSLVFITATNRLLPDDKHARKQIRKQAMSRCAHDRRKRGGYGQHNLIQYPVGMLQDEDSRERDASRKSASVFVNPAISANLASCHYEKMRMRYNFDLLDLSQLTSFHISYATASRLANKPTMLTEVLGDRHWSYLSYLPSRLGHNSALDKAAACVAARAQQWLTSPSEPVSCGILKLYSSALKALQAELQNPKACLQPDVLCATALLGVYELLKMSTEDAWNYHSTGAGALIKLRGPGRCESDFEKALLLSHVGQIFHEALNANEGCFLADDAWQAALFSIPTDDSLFSDRSEPIVSLLTNVCHVPEYFQKTSEIVCITRDNTPDSLVEHVESKLYHLRQSILLWHEKYFGPNTADCATMRINQDRQHEALGFSFAVSILLNRLLFCLDPVRNASCEETAEEFASKILLIEKEGLSTASQAELFMAIKLGVARTTLTTAARWREWYMESTQPESPSASHILPSVIFVDWCQRMGWKIPRPVSRE